MGKLAVFIGITAENNIVTGGERQIAEMVKGLERNGIDVKFLSVDEALVKMVNATSGYNKKDVYVISDYSKRFSLVKFNAICRKKYGFNVVCTVGAFYFDYRTSKIKNMVDYIVSYFYLQPADCIVTTGKAVENKLRTMGCKNKKIVNVYPAIRDSLIEESHKDVKSEPESDKKTVLTVGRFHPVKGYDYLLDAAKLCIKMEDIQFLIVGDFKRKPDNYYKHIVDRLESEGLKNKVIICGRTKDDVELANLYRDCWCYLHTSVWESSPITVCEPLLFGKPVIATNVGGTAEYLKNGIDSILVETKSGSSIAAAIKKIRENQSLYESLCNGAGNSGKHFTNRSWNDVGEEYYKALIC